MTMAEELFAECRDAASRSRLPDSVDRHAVSKLVTGCYLKAWDAG
jgi:hypothetical protein